MGWSSPAASASGSASPSAAPSGSSPSGSSSPSASSSSSATTSGSSTFVGTVTLASTVSGSSSTRDARLRREVADAQRVADHEGGDVQREPVGDLHRERLDVHLAGRLLEHAAFDGALRLADELHHDLGLDRTVEPDLVEVDVEEAVPGRVELVVLEDGVMRLLRALDDDVEDRVQAVVAGQDAPKLSLSDRERMRRLAVAVEHARDLTGRAQTAGLSAAAALRAS